MIDEDVLRDLLAAAAERAPVPEGGPEAVLAAAGDRGRAREPRWPRRLALAATAVAALAVVGVLAGRDGGDSVRASRAAPPAPPTGRLEGGVAAGSAAATSADAGAAPGAPTPPAAGTAGVAASPAPGAPGVATRVVKTGSIELELRRGEFGRAMSRLAALAAGVGGYIADTKTFEAGKAPSGTVTLRVPSATYEDVVSQVRRLGTVRSATSHGEDVTAQYTDLQARLGALTATRDQFLTILRNARAIGDILAVQDRINTVQVEIEQLQGQLKVLNDTTTYATLTVSLAEPGADRPVGARERSGFAKAWDDARDGFTGGLEWIVARSGSALVVLLAAALVAVVVRGGWKLARRWLV